MKSFIILVLLVALGAAAFFTRPSEASFKDLMVQKASADDKNILSKIFDQAQARNVVDGCAFKDRFLWVNVEMNGKTLYTGAFSHWFNSGAISEEVHRFQADAQK